MSCEKVLNLEDITTILTDVAGTTTSLNFVEETLFPYVIQKCEDFLKSKWEDENIKSIISEFEEKDLDATKAAELVKKLTEEKSKNPPFKKLQAMVIEQGYLNADFKGHVFTDVYESFKNWNSKKVAIYSTGSVSSQKLLFKYSDHGDISEFISNYFDQTVGEKTNFESFEKIAKELNENPKNILFLSDDIDEVKAAKAASFVTALILREGTAPTDCDFCVFRTFSEISFPDQAKRKLEENTEEPPKKVAKTTETETVKDAEKIEDKKTEQKSELSMEVDETQIEKKEELKESSVDETKMETEPSKVEELKTKEQEVMTLSKSFTENQSQTTISIAANEKKSEDEIKDAISKEKNVEKDTESKPAENGVSKIEKEVNIEQSDEKNIEETNVKNDVATKAENGEDNKTENEEDTKEQKSEIKIEEPKKDEDKVDKNEVLVEKVETNKEKTEVCEDKLVEESIEGKAVKESDVEVGKEVKDNEKETKEDNKVEEKQDTIEKEKSKDKIEISEKENKSELANGLENGTNGDASKEELSEVKAKSAEETVDAAQVTVEA